MRLRRFGTACIVIAALGVAACGSDDETTTTASVASEPSTSAAPETTASDTTVADTVATEDTADAAAWEKVVADATQEGTVVFYGTLAPVSMEAAKAGFEAQYPGITVEIFRGTSPEVLTRYEQEAAAGIGPDVMVLANLPFWEEASAAGDAAPIQSPNAQSAEFINPEFFKDTYLVPLITPLAIGWNTSTVQEPIDSYEALFEREDLADLQFGVKAISSPLDVSWYSYLENEVAVPSGTFLDALAAKNFTLYGATPASHQGLAAGEVDVLPIAFAAQLVPLKAQGAPVDWGYPDPTMIVPQAGGVLTKAAHPNAAQLFLDWLLSEDGQKVLTGDGTSVSPLKGDPNALDRTLIIPDYVGGDPAIADPFIQRFESLFGKS